MQAHRPSGRGIRARELRDGAGERVATLEGSSLPCSVEFSSRCGDVVLSKLPTPSEGGPYPCHYTRGSKPFRGGDSRPSLRGS